MAQAAASLPERFRPAESRPGLVVDGSRRVGPLAAIPKLLRELGVNATEVAANVGIEIDLFDHPDNTIPFTPMGRLFRECVDCSGCPHFGLLIGGERSTVSSLGIVSQLMQHVPDVGTALRNMVLYLQLQDRGAVPSLVVEDGAVLLGYAVHQQNVPVKDQLYDAAIAIGANIMTALRGPGFLPAAILLRRSAPVDDRPCRHVFKAPVEYGFKYHGLGAATLALNSVSRLGRSGTGVLKVDGKDAKVMRFDGVRGVRYCEVFLIGGDAVTKELKANFYNTTGRNNAADPRDTCPAELWAKVDADALKAQYKVLGVFKNGPRGWANDWFELPVGAERDFEGLKARWMGEVQLPKDVDLHKKGSSAYKPTMVARKSEMGFAKGKPVFALISPDGMPWVMQAYSNIVDPNLTYDDLKSLGKRLKLAPGWKFRVKVLDQDVTIKAINGKARIVQDDLENTYDACFEEAGQKACSMKP